MNIHEGTRALVRFSDRHVTRFRPIASTHFEMRYNKNN